MNSDMENPATRGDAGRVRKVFVSLPAMNTSETKASHRVLQLEFMKRRGLAPLRAELIASLHFMEARS